MINIHNESISCSDQLSNFVDAIPKTEKSKAKDNFWLSNFFLGLSKRDPNCLKSITDSISFHPSF